MKFVHSIVICLLLFSCQKDSNKSIKANHSEFLGTEAKAYKLHYKISNLVIEGNLTAAELGKLSTSEKIILYIQVDSAYLDNARNLTNGDGEEWEVVAVINSHKNNKFVWLVWPEVSVFLQSNSTPGT